MDGNIWKILGQMRLNILTKLYKKKQRINKMSKYWKINTKVPIYKNKEDARLVS